METSGTCDHFAHSAVNGLKGKQMRGEEKKIINVNNAQILQNEPFEQPL